MILVDIKIPSLDTIFDFELDEELPAEELVREVIKTIAEKEDLDYCEGEKMYLYAMNQEKILSDGYSLKQQGIGNGEQLVLI